MKVLVVIAAVFLAVGSSVEAKVGWRGKGHELSGVTNYLVDGNWHWDVNGCFLGKAKNLVVDPTNNADSYGAEGLDVNVTGRDFCQWLKVISTEFASHVVTWRSRQLEKRRRISSFNIYRRFREWVRGAPTFAVAMKVHYIDVENLDVFGNPLPWAEVSAALHCPDVGTSFGLFQDLCANGIFHPPTQKNMTLLLKPYPSYNRPVSVDQSTSRALFFGMVAGLQGLSNSSSQSSNSFAPLLGILFKKFSLTGAISDFWINPKGECYFTPAMRVDWKLFSESLCTKLHSNAGGGFLSAFKSELLETVTVYVDGVDLFSHSYPFLSAVITEGVVMDNVGDVNVSLSIDPNPQNVADAKTSKAVTRHTRAAKVMTQGAMNLFSNHYDGSSASKHSDTNTTTNSPYNRSYGRNSRSSYTNTTTSSPYY